jgi:hypothetical protein
MTIKIIASGQSNMSGVGLNGMPSQYIDRRVLIWNNANPLGANGSAFVVPVFGANPFYYPGGIKYNNLAAWFAHRIAREYQEDVRLVLVTENGASIKRWTLSDDASAPAADEMIAVWGATGLGAPADFYLWHQGEADYGTLNYATYKAYFDEKLSRLALAGVIDANTKIIIGGVAEIHSTAIAWNTNVLQQVAANTANVFYASSVNCPLSDAVHFSGASLYRLGFERYWDAVQPSLTLPVPDYGIEWAGGNGNGEWVRYNDGRMIQDHIIELKYLNSTTLTGNWQFPHYFIYTPKIFTGLCDGTIGTPAVSVASRTSEQIMGTPKFYEADFCLCIDTGTGQDFDADDVAYINVQAVGRWK